MPFLNKITGVFSDYLDALIFNLLSVFSGQLNLDLKEHRFKVLSVRNTSPGIFVAVYLIDIRLNVNSDIRHKIQSGLAE